MSDGAADSAGQGEARVKSEATELFGRVGAGDLFGSFE